MIGRTLILTALILPMGFVNGQDSKLRKANENYQLKAYSVAIPQYERLIGSSSETPAMRSNLATSYFLMGDYANAIVHYSVLKPEDFQQEELYNYVQSLQMNGNRQKAQEVAQEFCSKYPSDARCESFLKNLNYINSLEKKVHFTVQNSSLSSERNEFGAYTFNDHTYYFLRDVSSSGIQRTNAYNGEGFLDIYTTESTSSDVFSASKSLKGGVNTAYNEGPLFITKDNRRAYYTRNTTGKSKSSNGLVNLRIYYSDINENGKWVNEKELSVNSTDYSVGHPVLSNDGKRMIFASNKPGGFGGSDLYIADVLDNGDIANVKNLGNVINTSRNEFFPWTSSDGNLYFSSDGHAGFGGYDVFVAIMAADEVIKVENCGNGINSLQDDFAMTLKSDGINGYVSSNRQSGKGGDDIYGIVLTKPFEVYMKSRGIVFNKETNEPLAGATISVRNKKTGETKEYQTDENGRYDIILPEGTYEIIAEKQRYLPFSTTVTSDKSKGGLTNLDLFLEKDQGTNLVVKVEDKDKKAPMQGALVTIKDNQTNEVLLKGTTDTEGKLNRLLSDKFKGDTLDLLIKLEKAGYLSKEIPFNYIIDEHGDLDLASFINMAIEKIEVGKDLAVMVELKPIYYDLNSADIRADAKIELDKIIKVMNDNPTMTIELGSHTDCRSSAKYNLTLSDKRARSAADYIQKQISNPNRVSGKGYGESKLLNDCACEGNVQSDCSEEEHAKNRRTEFRIVKF